MKLRARRVTIRMAILVAIIVAFLTVAHWGTVRDHFEAWHFQLLVPGTMTVYPEGLDPEGYRTHGLLFDIATERIRDLANVLGCPLIFDLKDFWELDPPPSASHRRRIHDLEGLRRVRDELETNGWRVIEQRFPRRAYVVIRDEGGPQRSYVVQKGDTLALIAKKVYGDLAKFQLIEEANPDLRYRALQVGERIKVPVPLPSERAPHGNVPRS